MKIALIEAFSNYDDRYVFYPLGLAGLEAYLKSKIPDIEVKLCANPSELLVFSPDIAGISSTSPFYAHAVRIASEIKKELGIPVVIGGPHISSLPQSLDPVFDAAVIGEGEISFFELIKFFGENNNFENLTGRGFLLWKNGNIINSGHPEPIKDIDSLPFSKREWAAARPYFHCIFSSRGCPFDCSFCGSAGFWKGCRFFSPARVAEELTYIADKFDVSHCAIMDDLFAANLPRVHKLAGALEFAKDLNMTFTATLRADNSSPELAAAIYDMGVRYVHLGLESASPSVLSYLKGGNSSPEHNSAALINAHEAGMNTTATFIIGSPYETEDDIEMTYNFIKSSLADGILNNFAVSPLMPFPGTKIWDYAFSKGLVSLSGMDWIKLNIDIDNFSPDGYILLSEKMSRERFWYHFQRFQQLRADFFNNNNV